MNEDISIENVVSHSLNNKDNSGRLLIIFTYILFFFGILIILYIGYDRAAPFFFMDKAAAIKYTQETATQVSHSQLYIPAILINIFAVLFVRKAFQTNAAMWFRISYLAALTGAFSFMLFFSVNAYFNRDTRPDQWNVYYIAPDSQSYTNRYFDSVPPQRPPVYPLFIQSLTAGTGFSHDIQLLPRHKPLIDAAHPLMRVVHTQKVLLILASLICCFILTKYIDAPLIVLLFLALYDYGFYTWEINYILTEALTQAQIFLLVGVFLLFLIKPERWLLYWGGILCAALYLTRPASIYSGLLLAGMILWGLKHNWRRYWKPALVSVLLAGIMVTIPMVDTLIRFGNLKPTPMYYWTKIAYALQVAQTEDVSLMPDAQSRQFLVEAIHRRDISHARIFEETPDEYMQIPWLISANLNQVAIPLANEILASESRQVTVEKLLFTVSQPILEKRRVEHLQYSWHSFILATTRGTRLNTEKYDFWTIAGLCLIIAVILRGWAGYGAVILITGHLMHVMTVCIYDAPTGRYVEAAEFLVFIAIFILSWVMLDKIFKFIINLEENINNMKTFFINKLTIHLAPHFDSRDSSRNKTIGELSIIVTDRPNNITASPINLKDGSRWLIKETIQIQQEQQKKVDTESITENDTSSRDCIDTSINPLQAILMDIKTEWVAFVSSQSIARLHKIISTPVPGQHVDLLAFIEPQGLAIHPVVHISPRRPINAFITGICSFPVLDCQPEICIIRKNTALSLMPYINPRVPLPAAFGSVLRRAGSGILFIPDQIKSDEQTGKFNQLLACIKKLYAALILTFTIYPLRLCLPTGIVILIPGMLAASRLLSGRGGFVSMFISLLCLLTSLVLFLFGYLYDQLIKTRLAQAYLLGRK